MVITMSNFLSKIIFRIFNCIFLKQTDKTQTIDIKLEKIDSFLLQIDFQYTYVKMLKHVRFIITIKSVS